MFGRRYRASLATIAVLIALNTSVGAAAWFRSRSFDPAPSTSIRPRNPLPLATRTDIFDSRTIATVTPDRDPILVRPMFSPGRRQVQPLVASVPAPPAPAPVTAPPAFAVDGIVVRGDLRTAHIRIGPADAGRWIQEGTPLADWMLKQVSAYEVTFAKGEKRLVVGLYPESGLRFERTVPSPARSAP